MARYWNRKLGERGGHDTGPQAEKVEKFIEEVIELSRKHGLSIAHEDEHGAFLIENEFVSNFCWLRNAHMNLEGE